MFNFIKNLFKKEEEDTYPRHFVKVTLSSVARSKGINNEHNRIIQRVKEGKVVEETQYHPATIEAMKEVYEIPVYEETFDDEEEYDYDSFNELGVVKYKR